MPSFWSAVSKQEPKAAKNAAPAKPKKEETLMQDSNAKRGARNDRRARHERNFRFGDKHLVYYLEC